jgi:hypothetical protein
MEEHKSQGLALSEPANSRPSRISLKPTTFHRFSDLPQEVQSIIWGFVETEPRIIIQKYENNGVCFGAPYGPQVVLHVSSKARAEGLRRFRPVLASGHGKRRRYYHVDFSRDIFLLQRSREEKMEGSEWGSGIYWTISLTERIKLIRNVAIATYISIGYTFHQIPLDSPSRQLGVESILDFLSPHLTQNSALEEVLIAPRIDPSLHRPGELGFASLEQEPLWISDFKSYGSQFFPQFLECLIKDTKTEFEILRNEEKLMQERWNFRIKALGMKIGLRLVYKYFVTERNNRNPFLAGDVPLRSRYYVSR